MIQISCFVSTQISRHIKSFSSALSFELHRDGNRTLKKYIKFHREENFQIDFVKINFSVRDNFDQEIFIIHDFA